MATTKADSTESAKQRQRALQRWNNEGGAGPGGATATKMVALSA